MYVSINKQVISFQNFFGVLSRLCTEMVEVLFLNSDVPVGNATLCPVQHASRDLGVEWSCFWAVRPSGSTHVAQRHTFRQYCSQCKCQHNQISFSWRSAHISVTFSYSAHRQLQKRRTKPSVHLHRSPWHSVTPPIDSCRSTALSRQFTCTSKELM